MSPQNRFSKQLLVLGVMLLFVLGAIQSSSMRVAPARPLPALGLEDRESDGIEEKRPRPDHPDEAVRFRRLQMQDEKGFIPVDGLEKARRHIESMKIARQERINKGIRIQSAGIKPDSWTWMGPGNIGGRIRAIAIQSTNANNMWVGSVGGGIWRTTDAGGNWQPVNDFLANLAVSTLVINPSNANTMYAGTGEIFAGSFANPGNGFTPDGLLGAGVFRSTDAGVTWNQLPNTNPGNTAVCAAPATPANCPWLYVNRLAISPNGNTILAATGNNIQRSVDSGTNWTQGGGVTGTLFDIDFHPTDNQRAIASGSGGAVFSTDGGQTWTLANFTPAISGRVEIAYAPSNATTVYASVDQNNGDIYRSTNGGQNFTRVNTGTNLFLSAGNSQGAYDNIIWVNPQDATFVIVGGIDLWRSTDSGATFAQISRWQSAPQSSAHADHHMIVAHPGFNNNTNRTVFFGNDGGIYRADNVATVTTTTGWAVLNNNLGITQFYGAAANFNGTFIAGAQDNGVPRYAGNPLSWGMVTDTSGNSLGDGGYCAADPTDPNFFYTEYVYLQIYRSTNTGVSASRIDAGIADANSQATANFIAPFVLDPIDPNTMLAGGVNLWRSNDVKAATPTWNNIKGPTAGNSLISAIAVSPGNSAFILVGHNNGDVFLTFNGTAGSPIWTKIDTAPLPDNRFITRLVIDNTRSPVWIYTTLGGFNGDNIYRTTNLGSTWVDVTGTGVTGLPNVPVRSLVYHPRFPNFLYVGTEVGIFTSEDAGATWELPQDGPANVSVDELFWFRNGTELDPRELIAVTHGRGLYRASSGTYVDCNYTGNEFGTFTQPYRTIALAINATNRYQTIWIRPCNYNETFITPPIDKRLELRSLGGTAVIGRP